MLWASLSKTVSFGIFTRKNTNNWQLAALPGRLLESLKSYEEKKQPKPEDNRSANVTALSLLDGYKSPWDIWLSRISSSHSCIGLAFFFLLLVLEKLQYKCENEKSFLTWLKWPHTATASGVRKQSRVLLDWGPTAASLIVTKSTKKNITLPTWPAELVPHNWCIVYIHHLILLVFFVLVCFLQTAGINLSV